MVQWRSPRHVYPVEQVREQEEEESDQFHQRHHRRFHYPLCHRRLCDKQRDQLHRMHQFPYVEVEEAVLHSHMLIRAWETYRECWTEVRDEGGVCQVAARYSLFLFLP